MLSNAHLNTPKDSLSLAILSVAPRLCGSSVRPTHLIFSSSLFETRDTQHSCFAFTLGWLLLHVLPSLCCALSCAFLGYSRWGTAGYSRDPLPCTLRTVKGCLLTPYTWHPKATWDFCLVSDLALLSPLKEQSLASLFCKGRMFLAFWNTSRHPSRNVTHLYKICFYCKTQNVSTLEEFDIHSKLLG